MRVSRKILLRRNPSQKSSPGSIHLPISAVSSTPQKQNMPTPSRKQSKKGRAMTPNAFRRLVARVVLGRQNKQAFSYGMLEESIIVAKAKQTSTTTVEKNGAGGATEVKGNLHAKEPFIVLDYSRADDQGISVLTLDPAIQQQALGGEQSLLYPTTSCTSKIHTASTNNATAIPRSFDPTGRVRQAMENRYYSSSTTSLDPSRDDLIQNTQPRSNESPWRSKPTRACWI